MVFLRDGPATIEIDVDIDMARPIATLNPTTGVTEKTFTPLSETELATKLEQAERTFLNYRRTTFAQRAEKLHRVANLLEKDRDRLAHLATVEMGKPIAAAQAEIEKCAVGCRFYADHGAELLADQPVPISGVKALVRYQPLGVILAVMPWNFPFWQVLRFAAPALMAGNVALLKHSSNVPQCALAIEQLFVDAGYPTGCFQTLLIESEQIAQLVADPRIKAATLTGSEPAGQSLAHHCGHYLKKTVLELGGSDPFIVLPSADLTQAIQTAVTSRTQNNGQSCIAAKRFILAEPIADEFTAGLVAAFQQLKIGDPLDPQTQIGPLATPAIREQLHQQVQDSIAQGARLLCGGELLAGPGNFYPPTILTDIPVQSPAYHEELFGPVAAIFRVRDLDQALELANDTVFGLGASAWTQDPTEQERLTWELEAGAVFINSLVKSDPRLPFGGIKRSGYGRELGREGLLEFVNIKTVWCA